MNPLKVSVRLFTGTPAQRIITKIVRQYYSFCIWIATNHQDTETITLSRTFDTTPIQHPQNDRQRGNTPNSHGSYSSFSRASSTRLPPKLHDTSGCHPHRRHEQVCFSPHRHRDIPTERPRQNTFSRLRISTMTPPTQITTPAQSPLQPLYY